MGTWRLCSTASRRAASDRSAETGASASTRSRRTRTRPSRICARSRTSTLGASASWASPTAPWPRCALTSASYRGSGHPRATGFGAAVALYPYCTESRAGLPPDTRDRLSNLRDDVDTPLLILVAGADDQAPPQGCTERAEALGRAGHPVYFKLYPGALHAFDMTNMGMEGAATPEGTTTGTIRWSPQTR
jgi:acetyl esterase/lipase